MESAILNPSSDQVLPACSRRFQPADQTLIAFSSVKAQWIQMQRIEKRSQSVA